jgi:hypothetical protein
MNLILSIVGYFAIIILAALYAAHKEVAVKHEEDPEKYLED